MPGPAPSSSTPSSRSRRTDARLTGSCAASSGSRVTDIIAVDSAEAARLRQARIARWAQEDAEAAANLRSR
eukprot:1116857-Alexandrium_andersonii.AAC.1